MNKLTTFRKLHGSLSQFVISIILPLLLIFSMVCESARLANQKAIYTTALYLSSYSVLSSYCKEVYDDYGIFLLQMDAEDITDEVSIYLSKNLMNDSGISDIYGSFYRPDSFSYTTDELTYITDNDGRIFAESVVNYSTDCLFSYAGEFVISTFHQNTSAIAQSPVLFTDFENFDLTKITESDSITLTEDIRSTGQGASGKDYFSILTDTFSSKRDVNASLEEIVDSMLTVFSSTLLSLVTDDPTNLSQLTIEMAYLPSETIELSEEATNEHVSFDVTNPAAATNIISDNIDKTFYVQYLSKKFPCYTDYENVSSDEYPLLYQLEYILCGEEKDVYNLLLTATAMVMVRAALNLTYLFSDSDKISDAKSVAEKALSAFSMIPGLLEITTFYILTAWAIAEGVIDCRDLLANKKVPLIKTADTWTLDIENIDSLLDVKSKNDGSTGLSYKDYLLCMIMIENNTETYLNTMDMLQVNTEHKYDTTFRLVDCVYGFCGTLTTENSHIFSYLSNPLSSGNYSFSDTLTLTY